MDTYIYIACLRQVVATLPTFKLMRRLRRRNHEWVEVLAKGLQTICTITMSVRGVVYAYEAYEAK
jgi:hypothetical protein